MDVVEVAAGAPDDLHSPAVMADVVAATGGRDPQRRRAVDAGGAQRRGGQRGAKATADRETIRYRSEVAGEAEDVIGNVARHGQLGVVGPGRHHEIATSNAGDRLEEGDQLGPERLPDSVGEWADDHASAR